MTNITLHLSPTYEIEGKEYHFDQEAIEMIRTMIGDLLRSFSGYDLSNLTDIYFPSDYDQKLFDFQTKHNHEVGYTNTQTHQGFAMIIEYFNENQEVKSVVFYKPIILLQLYGVCTIPNEYPERIQNLILGTFYHELFHVHDFSNYQNVFKDDPSFMFLFEDFFNIWSEYYVHRMIESLFPNADINDVITETKRNLRNLDSPSIDVSVRDVLSLLGRNIGEMHSLGVDLIQSIDDYPVSATILRVERHLDMLFNQYPKWTIKDLESVIQDFILLVK
ncbi:hypothetical protein [Sporosarcina sp. Te-1]|uniref:hypothetical protein n=1 Tax=Sporosarcina sp. Te-1 TaxID=2818390 RepID=UPI001A9E38DC|nr:hypothetical protein [Sporosarcina sp. Te-1]QTD41398.1 hypothetical protein J3U78_00565 [Sporosarcina sp. Te-1]